MRILVICRYICMTITDAINSFLQYISTERRLSERTVVEYDSELHLFADYLLKRWNCTDLASVTHLEIRDWQASLADRGVTANSIKTKLVVVRSFYRYLRRQGYVTADIMSKIVTPKVPKRMPVFFTEKETRFIYNDLAFPETFEGRRDQLLLRLLYETGMRRAEVVGLTEKSVDFASKTLKVLGKRDKERIIPIENELAHTIKCYFSLKDQEVGPAEAFFVRLDGTPFKPYDVAKVVKQYMTAISHADRISPHVFRHSFATHLLNEGADIGAIKELLGHSDLSATEVYTHVSRQHIKESYKHAHPREIRKRED